MIPSNFKKLHNSMYLKKIISLTGLKCHHKHAIRSSVTAALLQGFVLCSSVCLLSYYLTNLI